MSNKQARRGFLESFGVDRANIVFGSKGGLKANSFVVWEGPSRLDGKPIVMIAAAIKTAIASNVESANGKTGAMVQSYFLRADVSPLDALASGADVSICGKCPLRGASCYVQVGRAPQGLWEAYKRGTLPVITVAELAWLVDRFSLGFRFGSYGDPASVDAALLLTIKASARLSTGYSHNDPKGAYKAISMMSADTVEDAIQARDVGRRSFRVGPIESRLPWESLCPASAEGGRKTTCEDCGLCDGTRENDSRRSIFIPPHGAGAKKHPAYAMAA